MLGAGARAQHPDHRRSGAEPLVRPARLVPGGTGRRSGQPRARPLPLPRRQGPYRRCAAQQLGVRLRRPRMDACRRGRRYARPVVPAPVRLVAARLRLVERGGARRVPPRAALLARPRCRRLPRRCGTRAHQGRGPARLHAPTRGRVDGRRRRRRALLGSGRRPRDLPRLARARRRVLRRPGPVRRGVAPDRREDGAVGAARRDAPGVQLRLPRDAVGCRGPPRGRDRVAAHLRRGRRPEHLGAVEPRRRAPRVASGPDRREPAGSRHRTGLARQAHRRAGPPARPGGDHRHAVAPRVGLSLPGRGARPARGHRTGRRRAPGPDVVPHGRRALRPRRLPGAHPVDLGGPAYGFSPTGASWLPQPAEWAALARDAQVGDEAVHSLALPHPARSPPRARPRCGCRGVAPGLRRATSSHSATARSR